jgi:hypothetical protein
MIKTTRYAVAIGTAVFSLTTIAQDFYITGPNYFGCIDKEKHNSLVSMIVQNDTQAFTKGLGKAIKNGACIRFPQGKRVFGLDVEITTGLIRIRPEGSDIAYWTVRQAIK